MKIGQLASAIAKKEGHKSKTRISDITKIINILSDMSYKSPDSMHAITQLGIQRAKRKAKKDESRV